MPFEVENASRRPGDPAILYASSELAKNELGWTPEKPDIVDIVRDAWRFHQQWQ
jgi:UDP-glucose 4-epimerase